MGWLAFDSAMELQRQRLLRNWRMLGYPGALTVYKASRSLSVLGDSEFIENTPNRCSAQKERLLAKSLGEIEGLQVYPSVTNFFLVKIQNRKIHVNQTQRSAY